MAAALRLAFFGSPEFAVPALEALVADGHLIAAVYTQPPKPAGRGHRLTRCAVHVRADALGLPVRTPRRLRNAIDEWHSLRALELDVAVVAAYGLILPAPMLDAPRRGCVNIHASLLPRWRGAAPIQAALLAGDEETGITIMQMDEGLDTGPMLASEAISIGERDTVTDLHDRLARLGGRLITRVLADQPAPVTQPEVGPTYAAKLGRGDAVIDWTRDAVAIDRQIRALNPWPGTQTAFRSSQGDRTLKILSAHPLVTSGTPGQVLDDRFTVACGTGSLRLGTVQLAGRPPVDALAFLRGHPLPPGTCLGASPG